MEKRTILMKTTNEKLILHIWKKTQNFLNNEEVTEYVVHYQDKAGNLELGYYTPNLEAAIENFKKRANRNNWKY